MSAELLRRAAKVLREHVANLSWSPSLWCPQHTHDVIRAGLRNVETEPCAIHDGGGNCWAPDMYDGSFIALMHPPVALALAALLDTHAGIVDTVGRDIDAPEFCSDAIAAVARAVLREQG